MQPEKKKKIWFAAVLVLLLAAGSVLLWKYAGTPLIRFISQPEEFRAWVESHGIYSRIAFVGMVVFQIIIAIIPGEPFEIAAGYAFGAVEGTILCLIACAIGSMLVFWLVRRFGMKLVRLFFSQEQIDSVRFLKSSSSQNILFLIVYMLPGTPKDLLGFFAGITNIPAPVFLLICTFGRIPSVITSTIGGDALGTQSYGAAVVVFAVTLIISAAGLLIYNRLRKRHEGGNASH